MSKIKIGIIGTGYIGGVHANVLARDERVQLTCVFDLHAGRAEQLARSTGATVAADAGEVIEKVDAVYITTPNTQHTQLTLQAIAAGKHVFCEKPMATTLAEAQAVFEATTKSDNIFQVGHNRRFAPVYAILKQKLDEGLVPHSAHIKMNRGELLNPAWVANPEITGGFLYETTIHMFDMARFQFGEVARLTAVGSTHEYAEEDEFSVLLEFANGFHATFASSADASWLFPFERIELFAHHATIVTREMESITFSQMINGEFTTVSMHQLSKEERWGYAQEDRAFIDAMVEGKPATVTALDGLKSVELVDGCYRAVRSGERISFTK
ncbi:MAG: Gfo/Idh/MocA family oxidoreductase [Acidobacteriota bacterium]